MGLTPRRHAIWALPPLAVLASIAFFAWPRPDASEGRRGGEDPTSGDDAGSEEAGGRALPLPPKAYETLRDGGAASVDVDVLVVDRDGRPVGGAFVEVLADEKDWAHAASGSPTVRGDDWGDADDDDDDGSAPPRARVRVAEATTGADGHATVRVWAKASCVFRAHDDRDRHGTTAEEWLGSPRPGPRKPIRIEIDALAILRGRVTDERGAALSGARVEVWALTEVELDDDPEDEGTFALTGADGRFRFELPASGAFDIDVEKDGFQEVELTAVQVLAGRETVRDASMKPGEPISGVLLDVDGSPLEEVSVFASPSGVLPDEEGWHGPRASEWTDKKGRFRFRALTPGSYVIAAEPDHAAPTEVFDVRTGTKDLVVRVGGGRIRATVSVADPDAHGARRSHPHVRSSGGGDWDDDDDDYDDDDDWSDAADEKPEEASQPEVWSGSAHLVPTVPNQPIASGVPPGRERESPSGTRDADGDRISNVSLAADGTGTFTTELVPAGTYDLLVAVGKATGRRRVTVTEGGVAQVSFALPETTASGLEGTVRNADGKRLLQCFVRAQGKTRIPMVAADPSGRFVFPYLAPGDYVLHAQGPLEGGGWGILDAHTVTVQASGRTRVDLVLPTVSFEEHRLAREKEAAAQARVMRTPPPPPWRDEDDEVPWVPDLRVHEDDDESLSAWVIVSAAPSTTPRLLGGDRILSIDGVSVEGDSDEDAHDLLEGEKGTTCRIRAKRPSTGETIEVVLPRVVEADEHDGGW